MISWPFAVSFVVRVDRSPHHGQVIVRIMDFTSYYTRVAISQKIGLPSRKNFLVRTHAITARRSGVLTLTISKHEDAKPQAIPIQPHAE